MRYEYSHDVHRALESQRVRHRERELGHRRALKAAGRSRGAPAQANRLLSRLVGGLGRMRVIAGQRRALIYGAPVLTDKVCHLADGSMGRVAIRQTGNHWVEVCVPAHDGR